MAEHEQKLIALGRTISQVREERGMSAAELAAAAGVGKRRLGALEAGRLDPPYDVLLALAGGLGVELAKLVNRAEGQDAHAASVAFGRRLRELRTEHGVSQERLARRTGIHRVTIGKLDRGTSKPLLSTILRLARGVGVKPDELVEGLDATEDQA